MSKTNYEQRSDGVELHTNTKRHTHSLNLQTWHWM